MNSRFITLFFLLTLLLASCQKTEETKTGTINGKISFISLDAARGAVKVQLQNASDASDTDIAFSEQDGSFTFKDVKSGFYYITPTKDGYSWIWTVVNDNQTVHKLSSDKRIKVGAGEIVNVKVLMSGSNEDALSILTPQREPINKLVINNGDSSASFVIFNGTGTERYYSLICRFLFKESFDAFPLFTSISPSSGNISPGESVLITCNIDQRVYNSEILLHDDIEITYNMKLPITLNWYY